MRAATSTASASSSSRCSPARSPTAPRTRWRSSTSTARSRSRGCRRSSRPCSRSSSGCWRRRRRIASLRRRRRPRRCSTRSMRGWRAGSRDERCGRSRAARGGPRLDPRGAHPAGVGRGSAEPSAGAAARSRQLREESRLERARARVRVRRGHPSRARALAPGARGAQALRAGAEGPRRTRGRVRAPAPRPLRAWTALGVAQRRARPQARSAARCGADRGALGGALCAPRPARAAAARAAVRGALGLRGAPLRAVHRLGAHGRPAGVAEPPRAARVARGAARDNRRPAAAFSLGPARAGARGLKAAAARGYSRLQTRARIRCQELHGGSILGRSHPAKLKMSERPHLLIVDDDREIRSLLAQYLEKHDFRTTAVADGKEMRRVMERSHVDLLVLDLMLPGEDGLTLCRELRSRSQVPIIMLTARGEDVDRIVGLELGADDYLPKPFNPRELLGRIKAILRRTAHAPRDPSPESVRGFSFGGWRLDTVTRTLRETSGREVALSGAEYRLLAILLAAGNRVLSRAQLTRSEEHTSELQSQSN